MRGNIRNRDVLCIALLLLLIITASCEKKKQVKTPSALVQQHEQLIAGIAQLEIQNRFPEAAAACNDFLWRYPQSPVIDHALFQCGLLEASEQNPQRNFGQSLAMLQRIPRQLPASPYVAAANTVVQLLDSLLQLRSAYTKQTETLKAMEAADLKQKQTLKDLEGLQAQQVKTIKDLQREIEKIKRIDLNKRP